MLRPCKGRDGIFDKIINSSLDVVAIFYYNFLMWFKNEISKNIIKSNKINSFHFDLFPIFCITNLTILFLNFYSANANFFWKME